MNFCKPDGAAVLIALLCLSACGRASEPASAPAAAQPQFSYDRQLGLATFRDGTVCLAIHNPTVKPGSKVTLVGEPDFTHESDTPEVRDATIVAQLPRSCDDRIYTGDRGVEPSFYRVGMNGEPGQLFVAVIDPATPITLRDGRIDADLDGDGTKEFFRTCASNEGVHSQVWSGPPLEGTPRWHWYLYAGYDTEYTCTEREYFGPK